MSENRPERKRESDKRKQEVRVVKQVEKTRKKVRKDAKIGRIRREERVREQEKALFFPIFV